MGRNGALLKNYYNLVCNMTYFISFKNICSGLSVIGKNTRDVFIHFKIYIRKENTFLDISFCNQV